MFCFKYFFTARKHHKLPILSTLSMESIITQPNRFSSFPKIYQYESFFLNIIFIKFKEMLPNLKSEDKYLYTLGIFSHLDIIELSSNVASR